jgi:Bacteriophage head to tail connecting protein
MSLAPNGGAAVSQSAGLDKRKQLLTRWGELQSERASWYPHWKELSQYLLPRSGRFFIQDRNKGGRRHNDIYDSTGTRAVRVLAAGMMSGMTSPARPWFRMQTPDEDLNKQQSVKVWLSEITEIMLMVFNKSNTYRALHSTYEELGVFGTSAKIIVDNFKTVIHHHSLTAGEYAIATDYLGNVNTIYREFEKTVATLVAEFGYGKCSLTVRNLYDRGALGQWIPIIHAIEPRSDRDPRMKDARNMAWASTYFEKGSETDKYLRESGYKSFPALCSRWAVSGGDIYGNSPGQEALGDVKQLQHEQLRKAQGIDYKTKPPLAVPSSLKNQEVNQLPSGITYYDPSNPQGVIKNLFDVNLDLSHLLEDIRDVRERIKGAFYADLWLMLEQIDTGKMTATEVAERKEEKLLMLGPVTERLHNEELAPLIDSTFSRCVAANIFPPPPPELHGMQLNVEFVSTLAQAQRAIQTTSIDRYVANLGQIATFKPDVLDKFDADAWADEYADMLGIDPELIVANDKVAIVRNQRAQAQAAAQKAAMANSAADTAQKLGNTPTNTDNALTALSQGAGQTLARGAPGGLDPTRGFAGYS